MKHPHAELLHAIADGQEIEEIDWARDWVLCSPYSALGMVLIGRADSLRIKPKTIRIGEYDVPEPLRVAPEMRAEYWIVNSPGIASWLWEGGRTDHKWLKAGFCHLTKEAAELHRKALIAISGGTE